jgi:microcompartment protein CcmL/EutN
VSAHVIPRPHDEIDLMIPSERTADKGGKPKKRSAKTAAARRKK